MMFTMITVLTGFEAEVILCWWVAILSELQHVHVGPCDAMHHGIWH